jgi:hypothetical protein
VELVEDHGARFLQERIGLEHLHENPLGDDQNLRLRPRSALEADLVANLATERPAVLLGHTAGGGPGGDAPRLQQDDPPSAAKPRRQQGGRHAGRLPRTRGGDEHGRNPIPQSGGQLGQNVVDGKRGRHGEGRYTSLRRS